MHVPKDDPLKNVGEIIDAPAGNVVVRVNCCALAEPLLDTDPMKDLLPPAHIDDGPLSDKVNKGAATWHTENEATDGVLAEFWKLDSLAVICTLAPKVYDVGTETPKVKNKLTCVANNVLRTHLQLPEV